MSAERHPHGTSARYAHGPAGDGVDPCRGDCCREAHRIAQQRRAKARAYGRSTMTPAGPTRAHVDTLIAAGLTIMEVARRADVSERAVRQLLGRESGQGASQRIRTDTAAALLAVTPDPALLPDGATIPADGTRRRIQAAVAAGHPLSVVAVEMDATFAQVHAIAHGHRRQVRAGTARAAVALIDRLWLRPPATTTPEDRRRVTRARTMAEREGWVPIAAWDDDDMDVPRARPAGARCDPQLERDVTRLLDSGLAVVDVARRLNRTPKAVSKVRDRIRREAEEAA